MTCCPSPKPIELDALRDVLQRWLPRASPAMVRKEALPLAPLADAGPALDLGYLARVVGRVETGQARELIDLFTGTARHDLLLCQRQLDEGDGVALALVMHKLKSSARMVGALRFASLAEKLEDAAKGSRLDAARLICGDMKHALGDIETALDRLADSLSQAVSPAPTFADTAHAADNLSLPQRALVVDDDPLARRQLELLLTGLGIGEVLTVEDGANALMELERTVGIDLLLIDLNMPGMDGIEFLRRLADVGYRGCLLVVSGVEARLLQSAADLARSKQLHLGGTLKKPATREALLALLSVVSQPAVAARAEPDAVLPDDILDGIRHDEFEVHFQPKVDASTLRPVGVEALARWRRDGKPVRPDLFIVAAEQHGLIGPLSEMLVTKALHGGARLAEAGFPLFVAVNLSAGWLTDIHLPEFILTSLQTAGFPAKRLILEITETSVMADANTALDIMTRLRLKGFKLSIDDFGTGYSSMEQLQRFPFGELKLDRSFVQGAAEKPATRAILAASLELALKLKLSTVAEGVETEQDLDLVRGLGCDLVQGWLIAKAMPLDELIVWLRERDSQA